MIRDNRHFLRVMLGRRLGSEFLLGQCTDPELPDFCQTPARSCAGRLRLAPSAIPFFDDAGLLPQSIAEDLAFAVAALERADPLPCEIIADDGGSRPLVQRLDQPPVESSRPPTRG